MARYIFPDAKPESFYNYQKDDARFASGVLVKLVDGMHQNIQPRAGVFLSAKLIYRRWQFHVLLGDTLGVYFADELELL